MVRGEVLSGPGGVVRGEVLSGPGGMVRGEVRRGPVEWSGGGPVGARWGGPGGGPVGARWGVLVWCGRPDGRASGRMRTEVCQQSVPGSRRRSRRCQAPGRESRVVTERSEATPDPQAHGPDVTQPVLAEPDAPLTPELIQLAHAYGVATEFWDWRGQHTTVPRRARSLAVLAALGVQAATNRRRSPRRWRRSGTGPGARCCPTSWSSGRAGRPRVAVHVDHGTAGRGLGRAGGRRAVVRWSRRTAGSTRAWSTAGWSARRASCCPTTCRSAGTGCTPGTPTGSWPTARWSSPRARLELPAQSGAQRRAWGFMTQLYSVRSRDSWGLGDLADLAELADWSAREHGAGLRAGQPAARGRSRSPPMEPSPYLPTSRRFVNPIYLRVEDIREVAYLPSTDRAVIEWQAEEIRGPQHRPGRARPGRRLGGQAAGAGDGVRRAPLARPGRRRSRRSASGRARAWSTSPPGARWPSGTGCRCRAWPAHALDPRSTAVAAAASRNWPTGSSSTCGCSGAWTSSWSAASGSRREAGMPIGIVHDLAVGVHSGRRGRLGAAATCWRRGVTVGAPPDAFNQQGQDWSQPPWRPDRLAELGYAPYRDMLRTVLRHCGGTAGGPHHRAVPAVVGAARDAGGRRAPTCATTTRR